MIYFAYGSNLELNQMKDRCPDSKLISEGYLKDYILSFDKFSPGWKCGVADIVKSFNNKVWGLLYDISERDLLKLDSYEGHPNFYRRIIVNIIKTNDQIVEAYTYEVVNKDKFVRPSKEYINIIKEAAKKYNFPISYRTYLKKISVKGI